LAGATTYVRLGAYLSLAGTATPLRLAEDIGVVDQAANGRLELGLVASEDPEWDERVRTLFGAWYGYPTVDGTDEVAIQPYPAQLVVPRVVAGSGATAQLADRVRGGIVVDRGASAQDADALAPRRTILRHRVEGPVADWLEGDVLSIARDLRDAAQQAGAQEVVVELPDADRDRVGTDVRALGTVLGTALRCAEHDLVTLADEAWRVFASAEFVPGSLSASA
jgi:alkanesulfonate monooxygenase SsuD/methylene tetrahydromethanopterin reductase-like flavin-dependent oxidoreductase (luciferase family)